VGEVVNRCPCSAAAAAKGHLDFFFGKQGPAVRHDGHGEYIGGLAHLGAGASTTLPGVKQLLLLVEKNPNTLVAMFNVTDSIDANIATRAKMGQSSDVFAVAIMADGRALFAKKEIKVTLGGCGG